MNVTSGNQVTLEDVVLDWQHFNNSGNFQGVNRSVDWTATVNGSVSGEIGTVTNANVSGTAGMGKSALVDRFAAYAAAMGVSGVHIVTGAAMRNVGFYERLGFREVARALRNGSAVVMLAKALDAVRLISVSS